MRVILIRTTAVMPDPPVEKMANELLNYGHDVRILAWDRDASYQEKVSRKQLASCETEVIHFGIPAEYSGGIKKNFKALLQFQFRIIRWLIRNRNEYDVVHAFDFDTGFASMLCCRMLGKKYIYHILDYYIEGHILSIRLLNPIIEFFEIRVINAAAVTIICTEKRKEQIRKATPRKLFVIHNTPDAVLQPDEAFVLKSITDKTKVAYVGVLSRMRLLKETVEAISEMDHVEMHIGGFGEYEDWMQDAANRNENIFFYGKLQYSTTLALEQQCDMMIATYDPSFRNHKYSAPNKFYESIMLGKPIIMAINTGYDDVISENDIGVLAEYSKDGICTAIYELNKRKKEWSSMGERAMQLYSSTYSWEIMKHRIREIYLKL
jgi:glycosyltransferase involved in cell wall biosynthesis